ncbi:hypothetical protein Ct61P_10545 [Colletotrichum tofieldiae]|nr:hypothetical protein Ct61P_10545 [Colletotrichum tofieldiae]
MSISLLPGALAVLSSFYEVAQAGCASVNTGTGDSLPNCQAYTISASTTIGLQTISLTRTEGNTYNISNVVNYAANFIVWNKV